MIFSCVSDILFKSFTVAGCHSLSIWHIDPCLLCGCSTRHSLILRIFVVLFALLDLCDSAGASTDSCCCCGKIIKDIFNHWVCGNVLWQEKESNTWFVEGMCIRVYVGNGEVNEMNHVLVHNTCCSIPSLYLITPICSLGFNLWGICCQKPMTTPLSQGWLEHSLWWFQGILGIYQSIFHFVL